MDVLFINPGNATAVYQDLAKDLEMKVQEVNMCAIGTITPNEHE